MSTIELDELTRHYPRRPAPAVHELSLAVAAGELLALLGPSGGGKSTVLKLITGIEPPDRGDIRIDGRSVLGVPAHKRGAVLMFQKAYLFPFLSVGDNIGFGLKVQGARRPTIRAEVVRMLDLVELPGIERRWPAQLSGGEQQRVALARSLITRPKLLMLDEPLSSLDTAVRQTLQAAIRRIQRELGITTLLVTHDLGEAIALSDRTALLLDGRLAACDRPDRLFLRPPTVAAARFVGVTTFLRGELAGDRLATALGALEVAPAQGPPRRATFAIRPEHTRLLAAPGPNTLPARVADLQYRGEYTEYELAVQGGSLRARLYGPPGRHERGDQVYAELPCEQLFEVGETSC
jgi:ABC-type Fe3+/spermidine/putrescine transport system ATPase subunit